MARRKSKKIDSKFLVGMVAVIAVIGVAVMFLGTGITGAWDWSKMFQTQESKIIPEDKSEPAQPVSPTYTTPVETVATTFVPPPEPTTIGTGTVCTVIRTSEGQNYGGCTTVTNDETRKLIQDYNLVTI